jgi:CelD/BcsL family acetyltransferase involved in cellulose biosynthesis
MNLEVEVVRGARGLESLRPEWEQLFDEVPAASPFLAPAWMSAWQATVGSAGEPVVFCVRRAGRLAAVLALSEQPVRSLLGRVRRLSFLGEAVVAADNLDLVAQPGWERPAAKAIVARLAAEPFDIVELDGLPSDSPMLQQLAWQLGLDRHRRYRLAPYQVCPFVELGEGWDAAQARSRRPHQFGRLLRDLALMDGFELRTVTDRHQVVAAFERLLTLHEKRWAVQGGSDAMSNPVIREFHRRLLPEMAARGLVRFEEMWVEGECRATYYGFGRGDHYRLYQTGYDPAWARRSVAFVRMTRSMQEAAERGVKTYDLLRGTETYKFDWATAAQVTMRVQVVGDRPAARAYAAAGQLRAALELAAEAVVPTRSLDLLRRWRRARQRREALPPPSTQPVEVTA